MGTGVAIAALVVGAAGAEAQRREAARAGRRARRAGRQAFREREAARLELERRETVEMETGIQRRARARQRRLIAGAQGRRATILTDPTGTVGESPQGTRTLLGT